MKPYPAYKPSGVSWLGEMPAHWESKAAKFLVSCNDDVLTEDVDPATEIVYVEIADVEDGQGIKATNDMLFKDAPSRARRQVKHGDIIVSTVRTYLKAIATVENPPDNLVVSTGFAVLRPHGVSQGFAKYAFAESGFINTVIARSNGVSYPAINATDLVRIPIPVPPVVEQQAIAAYLDRETARIDTLIAEKGRLIDTLREFSRSTFVGEFVAQAASGINAHPRIEWLPAIPSDWMCCKVKHIVESFDQGVSPQCEARPPEGDEWGVLKVGCVNTGLFDPQESKALPPDLPTFDEITLREGDVMISRANTRNLVGRCAVADKAYPRLMLSDKLYRLRIDRQQCAPAFFVDLLALPLIRQRIEERATGASASMLNIDRRTILELDSVLPPLDVQLAIVQRIQDERQGISKLVEHVASEIALLRELRAATITDAVTGKIQVS